MEKDNKFSFGYSEFEYLWDAIRRCPVATADITVTGKEGTRGHTKLEGTTN